MYCKLFLIVLKPIGESAFFNSTANLAKAFKKFSVNCSFVPVVELQSFCVSILINSVHFE